VVLAQEQERTLSVAGIGYLRQSGAWDLEMFSTTESVQDMARGECGIGTGTGRRSRARAHDSVPRVESRKPVTNWLSESFSMGKEGDISTIGCGSSTGL
jgi:hypothetical protein